MESTRGPTAMMQGPRRIPCHSPAWWEAQHGANRPPCRGCWGTALRELGDGREAPGQAGFCRSDSQNPSVVPTGVVPTRVRCAGQCWSRLDLAPAPGFKLLEAASVCDIDKQHGRVTGGPGAALATPGRPGYTPAGRGPQRCRATQNSKPPPVGTKFPGGHGWAWYFRE